MAIEKTYQPGEVEGRIYQAWEAAQAFRAGRPDRRDAQPYTIVIPPPNVTGSLHMGHALNNTLQDILCRFERMRGRDVLWQPGMDHAGIATQMVVERKLAAERNISRRDMIREDFLAEVWAWKAESGGTITNQLKRLGASCDWARERFTMDEGLSKAVLKVFVELYRQDLIYKDKRLVNWDPKLLTAISDLEVQQIETKGSLWYIKYPIEGADGTHIIVATTRPETMLGDTAVAVHPDDERYRHLIGKHAILPLVGRRIPIVADEYSDPEKGTGAVKITPAHDFNDFEVGRRHHLPQINVMSIEAGLDLQENAAFLEGLAESPELAETLNLHGVDRFTARKKIIERLEATGLIDKIEPHTHMVPHGDRGGVPIEPFLTDQWYVNAKELSFMALAAVRDGRTKFVPQNWEKTYFDWMENIQPWCISRQLWWGHQIPAWYGPDDKVFVAETEDEALAEALAWYVVNDVLTQEEADTIAESADRRATFLTRDEDVLDTWFSSALWPFSTLGWPDDTPEVKRYYPTNALVTGFDIIFFWVARMMMMGLHFMKEVPFDTVYIHALVRDERGAKMSKSKGNIIDPLHLIDDYGADALRFTLAAMAAQGRDIKLSAQRVEGYRNFATKLWNAARFAEMNSAALVTGFDPRLATETLNKWIGHELAKAGREITAAVEAYKFNEAAGAAYRFVWNVYCDWYLELAKPVLTGPDGAAKTETRAMVAWVRDEVLKLLHPFMPFITEELWQVTSKQNSIGISQLATDLARHNGISKKTARAVLRDLVNLVTEHLKKGNRVRLTGLGSLVVRPRAARNTRNPQTGEPMRIKAGKTVAFSAAKALDDAISLAPERSPLLALGEWPLHEGLESPEAEAEIGWVVDLVAEIRSVRVEMNIASGIQIPLVLIDTPEARDRVARWADSVKRLGRLSVIEFSDAEPPGSIQLLGRAQGAVPLKGVIDVAAEQARLVKEMAKVDADIKRIDAKLGNPEFVRKAPEEIIEGEKEKREEAEGRRAKILEALERLKGAA